jgi:hypothetical protein
MIYLDQGINTLEWMVDVLPRPWVSLERFGSSLNLLELKMQLLGKIGSAIFGLRTTILALEILVLFSLIITVHNFFIRLQF